MTATQKQELQTIKYPIKLKEFVVLLKTIKLSTSKQN